jgi:hypothetical protein
MNTVLLILSNAYGPRLYAEYKMWRRHGFNVREALNRIRKASKGRLTPLHSHFN